MAKDPALGIRLEPDEREALDRAAKADERALSAMGRKIIVEWLRTNGWMPERRQLARETKGKAVVAAPAPMVKAKGKARQVGR